MWMQDPTAAGRMGAVPVWLLGQAYSAREENQSVLVDDKNNKTDGANPVSAHVTVPDEALPAYAGRPVRFLLRYMRARPVGHALVFGAVGGAISCIVLSSYGIRHLVDLIQPLRRGCGFGRMGRRGGADRADRGGQHMLAYCRLVCRPDICGGYGGYTAGPVPVFNGPLSSLFC